MTTKQLLQQLQQDAPAIYQMYTAKHPEKKLSEEDAKVKEFQEFLDTDINE